MRHLIRSDRSRPLTCFEVVTVVGGVLAMPSHWAAVFTAFALAGAGHGWLSPIQVCWIGLLTGPLILVGWHHRRKWWGQALAMLLIAVLVAADYEVVKRTMKDTTNFEKVWRLGPEAVITLARGLVLPAVGCPCHACCRFDRMVVWYDEGSAHYGI